MCGIVGFSGSPEISVLKQMNAVQRRRGPDQQGEWVNQDQGVSLAMSRLAILDIQQGRQPMSDASGRLTLVFNGEIFNHEEIRRELKQLGYVFRTDHSDTETLLLGCLHWGEGILDRLNGMYSFVVHDRDQQILWGARDPLGIKPFHYSLVDHRFSFASELKSLLQCPWLQQTSLNDEALSFFLSFQCVPAPYSIYKNIFKLRAGEKFSYDLRKQTLQIQKYWNPPLGQRRDPGTDLHLQIREQFDAAVRRWSLSDVPLAVSLSGGIDSTSILASLGVSPSLKSFSLGFRNAPELDERDLARSMAQKYQTDHHEIIIDTQDVVSALPEMIEALDEPYAGGLPSWFIYKGMAEHVKVGFTGTGGDELFGHYGRWWPLFSWKRKLKRLVRQFLFQEGSLNDLKFSPFGFFFPMKFRGTAKGELLATSSRSSRTLQTINQCVESYLHELLSSCPSQDSREQVPWIDDLIQLPEEFLMMTDRFSMHHSLEARTPFLDRTFVEFILSLDVNTRIQTGRPLKALFLDAVGDRLTPEILSAPKKGFGLPYIAWMQGPLSQDLRRMTSKEYLLKQGLFEPRVAQNLWLKFQQFPDRYFERLWTFYQFQLWWELKGSFH